MTARGRWRQEDQNLKIIFVCKAMLRPARDSWETRKWNNDSEGSGGVEVWVLLCAGMDQSQWPLLIWIINICRCKNKRKAICYWTILRRKLRSQLGCVWAHLEHCDKRLWVWGQMLHRTWLKSKQNLTTKVKEKWVVMSKLMDDTC